MNLHKVLDKIQIMFFFFLFWLKSDKDFSLFNKERREKRRENRDKIERVLQCQGLLLNEITIWSKLNKQDKNRHMRVRSCTLEHAT